MSFVWSRSNQERDDFYWNASSACPNWSLCRISFLHYLQIRNNRCRQFNSRVNWTSLTDWWRYARHWWRKPDFVTTKYLIIIADIRRSILTLPRTNSQGNLTSLNMFHKHSSGQISQRCFHSLLESLSFSSSSTERTLPFSRERFLLHDVRIISDGKIHSPLFISKKCLKLLWIWSLHCLPSRTSNWPNPPSKFEPFIWLLWNACHTLSIIDIAYCCLISSSSIFYLILLEGLIGLADGVFCPAYLLLLLLLTCSDLFYTHCPRFEISYHVTSHQLLFFSHLIFRYVPWPPQWSSQVIVLFSPTRFISWAWLPRFQHGKTLGANLPTLCGPEIFPCLPLYAFLLSAARSLIVWHS